MAALEEFVNIVASWTERLDGQGAEKSGNSADSPRAILVPPDLEHDGLVRSGRRLAQPLSRR